MTGSWLGNICWPARFPTRWFALFGLAAFCGAILAVLFRPVRPLAQADVRVNVRYAGEPAFHQVRAHIYLAKSKAEMNEGKAFYTESSSGAARSQTAGEYIDFMVQPLDLKKSPEGEPVYQRILWPSRDHDPVKIDIARSYRRPASHPHQ